MKYLFVTMALTFSIAISYGQRLSQITLSGSGTADVISFLTDDAVYINLSKEGKIIDWGIEITTMRYNNYPGKLDPYMGRVEYFSTTDNEDIRGKVKYIGRTAITYYSTNENEAFKGKVKSIGSNFFDYYDGYGDEALKGKIKNVGSFTFSYYSSYENEAFKGKFKNIGPTILTYYASYDDKAFKGKIKSIGSQKFIYYSSFDRPEYQGSMKGGNQMQYTISGIKYLLR